MTIAPLQIRWDLDPEIFTLFGTFPIKYYGLLFMGGLLLSYKIVEYIFKKEEIPQEKLDKLFMYCIAGIFIGMRLGHCLFYDWEYYSEHILEIFLPFRITDGNWQFIGYSGLASHGGGIGVIIAIILYCRKYELGVFWLLDRLAIVTPVAGAFIRLGNFFNSEIYGKPTNGDYGVIFVRDDLIPRHPTQLYEAFSYLSIFALLWFLYFRTSIPKKQGVLFGILLSTLFLARLVIEFFKENQVAFEDNMTLNMGQWLSIPFIAIGLLIIVIRYSNISFKKTI